MILAQAWRRAILAATVLTLGVGPVISAAAAVPASATASHVAQQGPALRTVHVQLKMINVYDDGDAGAACGDNTADVWVHPKNASVPVGNTILFPTFEVRNGQSGTANGTDRWCSDHFYNVGSVNDDPPINKSIGKLAPGSTVGLTIKSEEFDYFFWNNISAVKTVLVEVPQPGDYKDITVMVEGWGKTDNHMRASFTIRVRTF